MTTKQIQTFAGNAHQVISSQKQKSTQIIHNKQTSVEQETNTARSQHSLLHWKTLLVTATHYFKHVTPELLQKKKGKFLMQHNLRSKNSKRLIRKLQTTIPHPVHLHWLLVRSSCPKMHGCNSNLRLEFRLLLNCNIKFANEKKKKKRTA